MSVSRSLDVRAEPAVLCEAVVKHFYFYTHRTTSLREWFIRALRRRPIHIRHLSFSLTDFHLRVERGETVALIGRNGSGKSTALRVIAGIYTPSSGVVRVEGRIGAVIELGAGFHGELTGAENVEFYASVMGLSRTELVQHRKRIVEFAELGEFIDMPVKYYSSGMQARLAFAVAVCVRPEVLLLDEVLAVGDQEFQEKCLDHLDKFKAAGGTMVVVSHDAGVLRRLCDRAVWLERGAIRREGAVDEVLDAYATEAI